MILSRFAATLAVFVSVPVLWAGTAIAQDRATPEEAQAMAVAAAELYHAEGADAAFEAYNGSPDFQDRDLYVFAVDMDGVTAAHGANVNLVGREIIGLRDPSGREFIREFLEVADTGWVDYQWQNPETGNVEDKTTYIINVGDYVIGVGAYR